MCLASGGADVLVGLDTLLVLRIRESVSLCWDWGTIILLRMRRRRKPGMSIRSDL